jgi:hypothetical protein
LLPASALLSPTEYCRTGGTPDGATYGNIRLHLGNYTQKGSGNPQQGKERESHHITQYLLVQYFHNGSTRTRETEQDRMAFPLLRFGDDAYGDALTATSGRPQSFRDIQISSLEAGRGGLMPTILLARPTHRSGNLHVNPSAEDFSDTEVATQSQAVNHIYKNELSERQRTLEEEVFDGTRNYREWVTFRSRNDITTPIHDAMQATYRYMRTYMQRQLRSALLGIERNYYNDLHLEANPGATQDAMARGPMITVYNAAVRHNNETLRSYGWNS